MRSTASTERSTQRTECPPWDVLTLTWSAEVLLCLHEGPHHFNALRRRLDDLPASTLSTRLGEHVDAGLVVRTERGDRPARVGYALSERGARLAGTLRKLEDLDDSG